MLTPLLAATNRLRTMVPITPPVTAVAISVDFHVFLKRAGAQTARNDVQTVSV